MSEVDCQETKRHVHEYLKAELGEQELHDITAHLANCDSCEADYAFEDVFNSVIVRSCSEAPPQELAERILAKVRDFAANNYEHESGADSGK
jgi:mycothiol system anti-sigma-R factor